MAKVITSGYSGNRAKTRPLIPTSASTDSCFLPNAAAVLFVLTFAIKAFADDAFMAGGISATVAYSKYIVAAMACLFAAVHFMKTRERVFNAEFGKLMTIGLLFVIMSLIMQLIAVRFETLVYVELFKLIMPMILAYCMLNVLDEKLMYKCMVAILAVSFAGYLYWLNTKGVSVVNFLEASFSESRSATESSSFAGVSIMLVLYFAFFRKSKLVLVVATVFCVLTFKRLALAVAVIALFLSVFFPKLVHAKASKSALLFLKFATLIGVGVWFWLLLPGQEDLFVALFGGDPNSMTMGRSNSMRYLLDSGFQSYGLGSASDVINHLFGYGFEMDLIKIAFELTPIALIAFVWLLWDLAGTNLWGCFIVGYLMLNMITSDSLTSNFSLTLAYMVIGMVNNDNRGADVDGDMQHELHQQRLAEQTKAGFTYE